MHIFDLLNFSSHITALARERRSPTPTARANLSTVYASRRISLSRANGSTTMDPLQASFDGAVWFVNTKTPERKPRIALLPAQKLQLYGLFKVATAGPKTPSKTASQQVNGDAWAAASHLTKQEAMMAYVELLHASEPSWRAKAAAAGCPTLIAAATTSTAVWTPSKKAPEQGTPAKAAPSAQETEDAIFSPARKVLFSPFSEAVRTRVRKVYTTVEHQQRPDVDSLLVKYAGQEAKLMQLIEAKYGYEGPTPRPSRDVDAPAPVAAVEEAEEAPATPPRATPPPAAAAATPSPPPKAAAPVVAAPVVAAAAAPAKVATPVPVKAALVEAPEPARVISHGEVFGAVLVVSGLAIVALEMKHPGLVEKQSREVAATVCSSLTEMSASASTSLSELSSSAA